MRIPNFRSLARLVTAVHYQRRQLACDAHGWRGWPDASRSAIKFSANGWRQLAFSGMTVHPSTVVCPARRGFPTKTWRLFPPSNSARTFKSDHPAPDSSFTRAALRSAGFSGTGKHQSVERPRTAAEAPLLLRLGASTKLPSMTKLSS